MNQLRLHWSSSIKNGKKNFGDWLSPILIQHLSKMEVVHASPNQADLVAVGSLLQRLKNNFWNRKTNIWGSGFIAEQHPIKFIHQVYAIRGKKSASIIKNTDIVSFGDPGLLVDQLLPDFKTIDKKFKVGIVCHYKDAVNESISQFKAEHPDFAFIDIFSETFEFLRLINSCEFVFSSSLHGLVTADAFGIPNARLIVSDALKGGNFKFEDYYSVYDEKTPQPVYLSDITSDLIKKLKDQYSRQNLPLIKAGLISSFPFSPVK
jgi:pyruvyltransferase